MQEEKKPNLESRKLSQNNSKMNRRTYEKNLSDVKIPHHYTGFTNRILIQEVEAKKQTDVQTINFFIPVYVILKIKSIQDIDIQKLTGSISSVIIINVKIQNLPEPIIYLLETGMTIQLNRSQLVQLKESQENNISVSKKDTMLIFTLRKTINGSIVEDTLWSPFEVIRIVLSITFNSIKKEGEEISHVYLQNEWRKKQRKGTFENIIVKQIGKKFLPPNTLQKREKPQIYFDQIKDYNISFNCMRNNHFIPISYSMGCVYSVYDLAERKLQSYHTNLDSYSEIVRKYQKKPDYTAKSKQQKSSKEGKEQKVQNATNNLDKSVILTSDHEQFLKRSSSFVSQYLQEIYTQPKEGSVQKGLKKPKYYQYTHFVIPLYKYPGNSLATIFVPIFLLGLLSLAIFFQDNQLSERIGSIATMVLGYIALIPSIKEQLPPSSRITIIERVIYLSTLCCLLSLTQSFMVDQDDDYVFIWTQNKLFLLCLGIHISVFVFILSLLAIHKLKWQKQYNYEKQVKIPDPVKANDTWINIYCDQQFFKVNNQNYKNQKKQKNTKQLIKKYEPKYKQEIPPPSKQVNAFLASIIGQGKVENVFENIQPIIPKDANKRQTVDQEQGSNSKSQFQTELFGSMLASKNVQMLGSSRLDQIGRQIERQDSMNISKSKSKISKPKLMHHSSLEFLDDLIKSGKHFNFTENHKVKPHQAVKNKILKKMRNSLKSD